jgi:hypothetical protein
MDWQTLLRATVPLGAALLALAALIASRHDRTAHPSEEPLQAPANDSAEPLARARVAPQPSEAPSGALARAGRFPPMRAAAASILVLLAGATTLVFATSRPLADVEIVSASMGPAPCPAREACAGTPTLSLSGTLGGTGDAGDAIVYVLVRPALGSEWTVSGETHPSESGDWTIGGVAVPASTQGMVDVRAVLAPRRQPLAAGSVRWEKLPGSRVVQVAAAADAATPR